MYQKDLILLKVGLNPFDFMLIYLLV